MISSADVCNSRITAIAGTSASHVDSGSELRSTDGS